MKEWSDIGSTCKFRSAFRNLHVDPLSLHTFMRNKQVEFNPYIYTLITTLSRLYRFGYEYPFFSTKHPVIILRVSLFAVTPSHVASTKIECQNFSYVYRSRKHWECKYYNLKTRTLVGWLVVLRIYVDLVVLQSYRDLEAGDNQSQKIQVTRPEIESRTSCSASQELNNSATTAPKTRT